VNNTALSGDGGAVVLYRSRTSTVCILEGLDFVSNHAEAGGGALAVTSASVSIQNCSFTSNVALPSISMQMGFSWTSVSSLSGIVTLSNMASPGACTQFTGGAGGAMVATTSSIRVAASNFSGNLAGSSGALCFTQSNATLSTIELLFNNATTGGGGGVFVDQLSPFVQGPGVTTANNTAIYGSDFASGAFKLMF
jgi:hypothetical protein